MFKKTSNIHRAQGSAFSLVELLVVVGILALLMSILLPAISQARESARRVACLANVRSLTQAALLYAGDNRQYLPEAASANTPLESQLCPRSQVAPAWTRLGEEKYVLPSIGGLLEKYLRGAGPAVWRCPSGPEDSFAITGADPFWAVRGPDEFKPHYNYLAGKELFEQAKVGGPVARQFKLREWAARNVSGLKTGQVASAGPGSAKVVLFHDRASTHHSPRRANIYTAAEGRFYASYGYLDGHAEGRSYRNVDEYIGGLHRPIRQRWFGVEFEQVLSEQYGK